MKRILLLTAFFLAFCMISGCGDKDKKSNGQKSETIQTEAVETGTAAIPEYTTPGGSTMKNDVATFETAVVPDATTALTVAVTTCYDFENITTYTLPSDSRQPTLSGSAQDNESTELAEVINDALGRTEDEWLAQAQTMYMEACETAFRFLCTGSEFPVDRANLDIIDKTYFLTTCSSFEDATASYYEIFSSERHKDDFGSLILEQNGRLYVARGSRGMDMTYLSSQVERLVSISDTEVVFEILVEYEDREVTNRFSLIAEEGELRVADFTLPY